MNKQTKQLQEILKNNKVIQEIIEKTPLLQMPNWYLTAGCIAQTVWNSFHGFEPTHGIKDYDLIYFDESDVNRERERKHIQRGQELFKKLGAPVEIVNEANVHTWFEHDFGEKMAHPYKSVEEAIGTWSTVAVCIGVKYVNGKFDVCAPYGLNDLFSLLLRPNRGFFSKSRHEEKINRWIKVWHKLKVVPWDSQ